MTDYGTVDLATPATPPVVPVAPNSFALGTLSFSYGSVSLADPVAPPAVEVAPGSRTIAWNGSIRAYVRGTDNFWHAVG